jgi:hypothetical protein
VSWVKLIESRDHLGRWIERNQQNQDVAPKVQEMYEEADWAVRTLENLPPEAATISSTKLRQYSEALYTRVTQLPMIPELDRTILTSTASGMAVSSSTVVDFVEKVSHLDPPEVKKFALKSLLEYRDLQESHQRPEEVRALLVKTLPNAVAKFDSARGAYQRHKLGVGPESAAAVDIRTFLDALKGELFERARRKPKEKMTFDTVLERLFSSALNRTDVEQQLAQRPDLYDQLSKKVKRRPSSPDYNVHALWTRVLDHAFIVANALPV